MPTGTVLFITSTTSSSPAGSSSTTDQTADRFASPDAVGGVPTQTKRNPEPVTASSIESVKERRSRLRSTSSCEPGLVERDPPRLQRLDPVGRDVADHDLVAELGETGPADEPCVPRAEECDPRHRREGYLAPFNGLSPLAIAIIVSFEMLSSSELTTQ